jgi:hypothetical protein
MSRLTSAVLALSVAVAALAGFGIGSARAHADAALVPMPRAVDGKPDLTGLWQALSTAEWNIQDHPASAGVPAGQGVVDGGEIPYQEWALKQKQENEKNSRIPDPVTAVTADPVSKCYMPGLPRATYMPYPFEIAQADKAVVMAYEFARTSRVIPTDGTKHDEGVENWMGDSRGHWEGDTLVVDVTGFNADTWFDEAGNFHSEALHLVERFTPTSRDHLRYDVTVEDPKVFTRPWKMSMPLYRRLEPHAQLLEYHCLEFLEPRLYSHLSKPAAKGK